MNAGAGLDAGPSDVDGGTDSGAEAQSAVWNCDGEYAFGATSELAFLDPTPPALGSALTTIEGATHPISLVLHMNAGSLTAALSATIEGGNSKDRFLPSDVPPLAPAVPAFGSPPGVTTVDPQPNAVLLFWDEAGPVDVQIEHVVWRATQGSSCADMGVSFQAVIPTSQNSIVLHLPAGDQTIGELIRASGSGPRVTPIGAPAPTPIPVEIAATFQGTPLDFDFDTL